MAYGEFTPDPQLFRYDPDAAEDRKADQDLANDGAGQASELTTLELDLSQMEIREPDDGEVAKVMRRYDELRRNGIAEQG